MANETLFNIKMIMVLCNSAEDSIPTLFYSDYVSLILKKRVHWDSNCFSKMIWNSWPHRQAGKKRELQETAKELDNYVRLSMPYSNTVHFIEG